MNKTNDIIIILQSIDKYKVSYTSLSLSLSVVNIYILLIKKNEIQKKSQTKKKEAKNIGQKQENL